MHRYNVSLGLQNTDQKQSKQLGLVVLQQLTSTGTQFTSVADVFPSRSFMSYLNPFPLNVQSLHSEIHPDSVPLSLHEHPAFEPLHHTRLSDPGISDQYDLEQEIIGVVRV